ncbi:MAG: sensor histidine kinase [Ignavibacteriales bacterium]
MKLNSKYSFLVFLSSVLLMAGVFIWDIVTPLGYSIWLLYIIPLLVLPTKYLTKTYIYTTAFAGALLTVLGFMLDPAGISPRIGLFNRLMFIVILVITAYLQTIRKKIYSRLDDSEILFRSTFEQANIGIGHISIDFKWLRINHRYREILGYSEEELSKLTFMDVTYPDDLKEEEVYLAQLRNGTISSYSMEKRFIHRNGSLVWVYLTKSSARDEKGNLKFYISAVEDISQRKAIEEALSRSEERFRQLADAMPQIVWSAEPDGYMDYFNERWYEYTGFNPGETMGWEWQQVVHPDDVAGTVDSWKNALSTGNIYEVTFRLKRHDGEYRWQLGRGIPLKDLSGKIIKWFGSTTDIHEQKINQVKLEVTLKELERSNKELEQFAYVASHDLQEPVRTVKSFTQLLERRYKDKLDANASEYISFITDGAGRMQQLINDLLEYSRVSTRGKSFQSVKCEAILDTVKKNLSLTIQETGAVITNDPLPEITADQTQLIQLFQNLISNAIKFTTGKTPEIKIGAADKGKEWIFSVSDNGIGIDPQYAEKIFVIFQRLHSREKFSGTGIGLAVCKKIVELHGGRIWVESRSGQGSTFYFTIPKLPS